jgi:hypothetical protein
MLRFRPLSYLVILLILLLFFFFLLLSNSFYFAPLFPLAEARVLQVPVQQQQQDGGGGTSFSATLTVNGTIKKQTPVTRVISRAGDIKETRLVSASLLF